MIKMEPAEVVEDLAALDSFELSDRIQDARMDRDVAARTVANMAMEGDPNELMPFALQHYADALSALETLSQENRRRVDLIRAGEQPER